MTTYRIKTDNTTLGKPGDTVAGDALNGLNVDALIDGGHLELVLQSTPKRDKQDKE
jgi:hypothetical protein